MLKLRDKGTRLYANISSPFQNTHEHIQFEQTHVFNLVCERVVHFLLSSRLAHKILRIQQIIGKETLNSLKTNNALHTP